MKRQIILSGLFALLMVLSFSVSAQVSINTDGSQPDPSAMLDVKSPVKGFLPPRVALSSLDVAAPVAMPVAIGLLVFNTATAGNSPNNVVPGYYYWNGVRWVPVATPQGINPGEMLYWNGNAWVTIPTGQHGQQLYFCDGVPTWGGCFALMTTTTVTNITPRSAVSGGNISSDGGSPVIARGVCWGTSPNPTLSDNKTIDGSGTGAFTSNITGLNPGSTYYVRAYATNSAGTGFGSQVSFPTGEYTGAPVSTIPVLSACPGSAIDVPVKVDGFSNVGSVSLTIHYNSAALAFNGATNTSGFPGLLFVNSEPGVITVTGSASAGISFPDNTVFFTMNFTYSGGGSTGITWFDNGQSCQYLDGEGIVMNDEPAASYYIDGQVNETPAVGLPVFALGSTSTRCEGAGSVTYTATANNSTGITYSLDALSLAGGNTITQNTGVVTYAATWSGNTVITAHASGCNGPSTSDHTVTTSAPLPVSIAITASANPVCAGTNVNFTAIGTNGGTTPGYSWSVNGFTAGANSATFSYVPGNGDQVTCKLTSSLPCVSGSPATSNVVSMTVNPLLPLGVTISASATTVCAGASVTFNATAINAGSSPAYQWKVNGNNTGTNAATFTYVPANNDVVTCTVTSTAGCVTGNPAVSSPITVTVNPLLPVSITVTPSANNVCAGTSVTFTSSVVNGGTSPAYQWMVNGMNVAGATNPTYSYAPENGNTVACVLTSNIPCSTGNQVISNTVSMLVNPLLPVGVSITASANQVCAGTSVTFTATPVNGGTSAAYQWKVNGVNANGATNLTYSYVPGNNDVVTCQLTSSIVCQSGSPALSNPVTMIVNTLMPVSVIVAPSANPVCAGTSVTYTATPVNGGTAPAYQWLVNGSNVSGATGPAYTFVPSSGNTVSCVLTSNVTCPYGNPANSNTVNMTVNPSLPVSVSISASATNICAGNPVTFTAVPVNGGTAPVYQWKVNGLNAGTNNATYVYTPVQGDVVTCNLTSNASCVSGNPASSNAIAMTVNAVVPVSVSITSSANSVCAGTPVTFTASAVNGGTTPAYQWLVNGAVVTGNAATYAYTPSNNDAVLCKVTSSASCPSGSPATSNVINMTVNPLLPVSVSVTASQNPVCEGSPVIFTANATNGGSTPSYQWKVNGSNVGAGASSLTYNPVNNDAVTCIMTSNAGCATGNPATAAAINMTVNPLLPVSVSITASSTHVCAGTSVTFNSAIINGGANPAIQWKVNGNNAGTNSTAFTYVPANGDIVTCAVSSALPCVSGNPAISGSINLIVDEVLSVGSVSSSQTIEINAVPAQLTGVPPANGTSPVYQWQSSLDNSTFTNIDGATMLDYQPGSLSETTYYRQMQNATGPCGGPLPTNVLTISVYSASSASVTLSSNPNGQVCNGTTVAFTATPVNGGTNPAFQWKVNGNNAGTNSPSFSYVPQNGDAVTCVMTSSMPYVSNNPAVSEPLAMSVNPNPSLPVSVTVEASPSGAICAGTQVDFDATGVNGGTNPVYQWKVNGNNMGNNEPEFLYTPVNGDVVTCKMVSSEQCVTGNPATAPAITMTVNPILPASITIAASANPSCATNTVVYSSTVTNGGTAPAYQWKVNGNNVSGATTSQYSYKPASGDVITCTLTSNAPCVTGSPATSNAITMTVNPVVAVSVGITASVYALMPGGSVTYTATPVNGGPSPSYQWKVNGVAVGTNSSTYTYTPADHDKVTCVVTSNLAGCLSNNPATSNNIVMIVYMTGTPCTGTPTVQYNGLTYNTVMIGTQCWLRESINTGVRINGTVEQTNNGVVEKYCYNNDEMNCNVYGGMYQWAEVVQYLNGATNATDWNPAPTGNVQGICPTGWHIPTNTEWSALMTSQGGQTVAGGKLKEATLAHFTASNVGGTNVSGFTAIPAGSRWNTGSFVYLGTSVRYWNSTVGGSSDAGYYGGASNSTAGATAGQEYKTAGMSVRCVKD